MAKIKQGILGPLSGRLGPVIGGMWKSIPYLRTVANTAKKSPRSPAQLATQEKMRFINSFLVPFHPYITVGFRNEAAQQTEISAAFAANYHEAILGAHPHLSVDFSKFILSKGILPMVSNMTAAFIDPATIQLTWDTFNHLKSSYDDQLMLVIYAQKLHKTDGFIGGVNRSAKNCIFKLNDQFIGKHIHIYASFTSLDRKRIANNIYLGSLG